jgi:hypothetical protein
MASTYSTSLRLQLIGTGDQAGTWGTTTNTNLGTLLEQSITGVASISIAGLTAYSLSALNGISDQSRNAVLIFTGALSGDCAVTAPSVNKTYTIYNNTSGGYAVNIATATGTAATVANGSTIQAYCDGTNFYNSGISAYSPTLTGIPTAPTAATATNNTQIATTAYVKNNLSTLGTMSTQNSSSVNITGGTITGTYGLSASALANTGGWSVTPTGTTLYFNYNGTNVAKLDSSGNLTVKASVVAYGTV